MRRHKYYNSATVISSAPHSPKFFFPTLLDYSGFSDESWMFKSSSSSSDLIPLKLHLYRAITYCNRFQVVDCVYCCHNYSMLSSWQNSTINLRKIGLKKMMESISSFFSLARPDNLYGASKITRKGLLE